MKFCPPNIDNCTIKQAIESGDYEVELSCAASDVFKSKNYCSDWNVPGLCDSSEINIKTRVASNKTLSMENCFHIFFVNGTVNGHESSMYCLGEKPKLQLKCDVRFDDEGVGEIFSGATDSQTKSTPQFWTFFLMLIISWAGMAVVVSVGDAICFEMLGDKPQKFGYDQFKYYLMKF